MKTINYTGSSKLISRIVNLLNRRAPLPLDGDGDPDWGSNGQVLSTDGNGNTAWVNAGGGGSGGHTIWNRIKSALTQRSRLWFADASVSDVSADDATKVEVVTELLNETAFDNLATDGTADGIYTFPDSGGEYLTADMVGYGSGSVADALDDKVSKSGDIMSGNLTVDRKDGTASAEGHSYFTLGNSTPTGTDQNSTGVINLYSETAYPAVLYANALTQTRYIGFPNKSGTVLMDSDLTSFSANAYQLKYSQAVGNPYRWTITRTVANPTFIFIHHSGGPNALVGVWMMNYWMPLFSAGSVMTVQSVDAGQIVIDVSIRYHKLEIVGIGTFTVGASNIPS